MLLILALACGGQPAETPQEVAPIERPVEVVDEQARADMERVLRKLETLDERLGNVELELSRLQEQGLQDAEHVTFNPSRTRLEARNLQDAVTELYEQVEQVERRTSQDMGRAGPGLYALPKDNGGPKGPANPKGGQQGPQGPNKKKK